MSGKKKQRTGLIAGIFVGLKILEVVAILVVTFGLYYVGEFVCPLFGDNWCFGSSLAELWFSGLIIVGLGSLVIYIIVKIIQANWDWAKKLAKV